MFIDPSSFNETLNGMEPNTLLLEIPNLLDDDFYAPELFITLKYLVNFMAKDPCDYRSEDDNTLGEFRTWTIQRACDPEISPNAREVAKNWFHILEELAAERKKIIKDLYQ
ncbi:MAG: hypothetical protein ACJAT2_002926 [Bacteriovoracaceae bacterium]|jgi:hypothetical protein